MTYGSKKGGKSSGGKSSNNHIEKSYDKSEGPQSKIKEYKEGDVTRSPMPNRKNNSNEFGYNNDK